ncbi:MAG TPA: hypothetical protein DCX54_02885 [Flavobacteriales bacterium]|nr:hypothetical protein [Flavobacteriales bacterium]
MAENDICFLETDIESNSAFFEKYKKQISIPYDDFLEDIIIESEIYSIEIASQKCGFFGINNSHLTILYIDDIYFSKGVRIFEKIKEAFELKDAFIPTTDSAALSIILENHKEIKIQALHFSDTTRSVRPAEFGKEYFRLAKMADLDEIKGLALDFLENYEEVIETNELYVLEIEKEILGIGIVVRNKIMKNCISIGVLTKESKRKLGVGRSIIIHLKRIAYEDGLTPVAGCWYYNTESRITLESAGYITKSKLLRVVL